MRICCLPTYACLYAFMHACVHTLFVCFHAHACTRLLEQSQQSSSDLPVWHSCRRSSRTSSRDAHEARSAPGRRMCLTRTRSSVKNICANPIVVPTMHSTHTNPARVGLPLRIEAKSDTQQLLVAASVARISGNAAFSLINAPTPLISCAGARKKSELKCL